MKKWIILFIMMLFPVAAFSIEEKNLYVFNWAEYMPDKVISQFQKETGIKVVYSIYDTNETMFAKVKVLEGSGYDLVFPSTYYVDRMRKQGLIQEIDKSRLSNFKNLNPKLLNKQYDPENKYSIPYLWGSTAIGINSEFIPPESITTWNDLWKPEFKGKVMLLDDIREVFGIGLILLGYSGNDTEPSHIEEAYKKIETLMPNVRLFSADSPKQPFLNQEVYIGMIWNGEAYMASQENPKIKYIYPKEGMMMWVDSMVIPKKAKNIENAYKFMDFILRPDIAKIISEEIGYSTPNLEALKLISKEIRENKTVYPDEEIVNKGEFQTDVGDAILIYEKYWGKLKAGK